MARKFSGTQAQHRTRARGWAHSAQRELREFRKLIGASGTANHGRSCSAALDALLTATRQATRLSENREWTRTKRFGSRSYIGKAVKRFKAACLVVPR